MLSVLDPQALLLRFFPKITNDQTVVVFIILMVALLPISLAIGFGWYLKNDVVPEVYHGCKSGIRDLRKNIKNMNWNLTI